MKTKRIIVFLAFAFWLAGNINAQVNLRFTPTVSPTQGGSNRVGNLQFDYTIGEPAQTTLRGGNLVFTQGFEQPEKPLPPVVVSQAVCSDSGYTFTFAPVYAGAGGDQVEWSLHSNFDTSYIITSGDTIIITVNIGIKDTLWIRSKNLYSYSDAIYATATVHTKPVLKNVVKSDSIICRGETANFSVLNTQPGVRYELRVNSLLVDFGFGNDTTIMLTSNVIDSTTSFDILAIDNITNCYKQILLNYIVNIAPELGSVTFSVGDTMLYFGDTSVYQALAANSQSVYYEIVSGGAVINSSTGRVANVSANFTVKAIAIGAGGCDTAFDTLHVWVNSMQTFLARPLQFVPNVGQRDSSVKYEAGVCGIHVSFLDDGISFAKPKIINSDTSLFSHSLNSGHDSTTRQLLVWNLKFVDRDSGSYISAANQEEGYHNYLIGQDTTKWQINVPLYSQINYNGIYANIDIRYFSTRGNNLKYDFIVKPGANISDIKLRFEGIDSISLQPNGDMKISTIWGDVTELAPVSYQEIGGVRIPVSVVFSIINDSTYAFNVIGPYDTSEILVIDPITLVWNTFVGTGSPHNNSEAYFDPDIFVSSTGLYIAGGAITNYPTTSGVYQGTNAGSADAFITKLNLDGTQLVFSTFFGGFRDDFATGIAVDAYDNSYVSGWTGSYTNPVSVAGKPLFPKTGILGTANLTYPTAPAINGNRGFVTKLNPAGTSLVYSTIIGGTTSSDIIYGLCLHNDQAIGIGSLSPDFSVPNSNGKNGIGKSVVFKLNSSGNAFVFCDEINSTSPVTGSPGANVMPMFAFDVTLDKQDNIVVCGITSVALSFGTYRVIAGNFPVVSSGAIFVSKLTQTGVPIFTSLFGGDGSLSVRGLCVDRNNNIFVSGSYSKYIVIGLSTTAEFPTTSNAYRRINSADDYKDGFISKISSDGSEFLSSTYVGLGFSNDYPNLLCLPNDDIFFVQRIGARPTQIPYPPNLSIPGCNPLDPNFVSDGNLYFATITNDLDVVYDETYFKGDDRSEVAWSHPRYQDEAIYISGLSRSNKLYNTPGVYQLTNPNGQTSNGDIFVAKLHSVLADAGEDKVICSGECVNIGGNPTFSGTLAATSDLTWSSDGSPLDESQIHLANPSVCPTVTTNYTVTINYLGCVYTNEITVTVKATPSISIDLSVGLGIPCSATQLTATNVPNAHYQWGNGALALLSGIGENVLDVSGIGFYYVTVTTEYGCSASASYLVSSSGYCCQGSEYEENLLSFGNNTHVSDLGAYLGLSYNGAYTLDLNSDPSVTVAFNGTLIVDDNFTIVNCSNVKFGPGAKIIVPNGSILAIANSHLYACDEMWEGIDVEAGGTLYAGYFGSTQTIEDALYAVHLHNGSKFFTSKTNYRDNFIGIYFNEAANKSNCFPAIELLGSCVGNKFEGTRELRPVFPGMDIVTVNNLSVFHPNYIQVSTTAHWAWAGIHVVKLNSLNIGAGTSLSLRNYFEGMANGIVTDACNLVVTNSSFKNIHSRFGSRVYSWGYDGLDFQGNGILSTNYNACRFSFSPTLSISQAHYMVETGLGNSTKSFDDCERGIVTDRIQTGVLYNLMETSATSSRVAIKVRNANTMNNAGRVGLYNNKISYGNRGIQMLNCTPTDITQVYSNEININAVHVAGQSFNGVGIEVQGNMQTTVRPIYRDNTITVDDDAIIGTWFNNSRMFTLEENEIICADPSQNLIGMSFSGCRGFTDRLNYVHGNLLTGDVESNPTYSFSPAGAYYEGNYLNTTDATLHQCNTFEDLSTGAFFLANNANNTHFVTNSFNPNTAPGGVGFRMNWGLVQHVLSTNSAQIRAGNQWFGDDDGATTDFTYAFDRALHGNSGNAASERFRVANAQGTTYFPRSFELTPSAGWFVGIGIGADNNDCNWTPPCTNCSLPTETDEAIANDDIVYEFYSESLKYENQEALYRRAKYNTIVRDSSASIDSFYQAHSSSNIAKFERIDSLLDAGFTMDSATNAICVSRWNAVDTLIRKIIAVDSLRTDITLRTWVGYTAEIDSLQERIDSLMQGDSTMLSFTLAKNMALSSGKALNASISPGNTIEYNLKGINEIFFNTLFRDTLTDSLALRVLYDSTTLATLFDVASQCPLKGGRAVFMARSLLSLAVDTLFIDEELCSLSGKKDESEISSEPEKNNKEESKQIQQELLVTMFPNPAEDYTVLHLSKLTEGELILKVVDALGRDIFNSIIALKSNNYSLNTTSFASGIYFLSLYNNSAKIFDGKLSVLSR